VVAAGAAVDAGDGQATAAAEARRLVQRFARSPAVRALRAERARGETTLKRARRARLRRDPAELEAIAERVRLIGRVLENLDALREQALRCDRAHLAHAVAAGPPADAGEITRLRGDAESFLEELWTIGHPEIGAHRALLGLVAESPRRLHRLASAYAAIATAAGDTLRVHRARRVGNAWTCELEPKPAAALAQAPEPGEALLLEIRARMAFVRWCGEAGVHSFDDGHGPSAVLVSIATGEPAAWQPPAEAFRRGWLAGQKPMRRWRAGVDRLELADGTGRRWNGTDRQLIEIIAELAAEGLHRRLEAALGDGEDES
jgi:hypothetical protein